MPQSQGGSGGAQNPLRVLMRAVGAIEHLSVRDAQAHRGEQLVEVVAVFVVFVFAHDQQSAAGLDKPENCRDFIPAKHRGGVPGGVFPFRIAGMQQDQHVRVFEERGVQGGVEVAGHGEFPAVQGLSRPGVGGVGRILRLHLPGARGADRPAFTVELVEDDAEARVRAGWGAHGLRLGRPLIYAKLALSPWRALLGALDLLPFPENPEGGGAPPKKRLVSPGPRIKGLFHGNRQTTFRLPRQQTRNAGQGL